MRDEERVRRMRARAQAVGGGIREGSAGAVVRRVFAVQAQDAVAADLGIRVRGHGISASGVRAAYEGDRSIVRGWFLRGTLHTLPAEDVRWVLALLGPRFLAASARRYGQLRLDEALRRRADRLLRSAVREHGPLTRAELTERLAGIGVEPGGQAPFHLIRHAALGGVLCHGPRRGEEATYVLLDDWLPDGPGRAGPEGDAAVAELARRYLRAHGPAAVEDFTTWSGLPLPSARRAWKALAGSGAIAVFQGDLTVLAKHGRARSGPAGEDPDGDSGDPGDPGGTAGTDDADDAGTPDVRMLPAYDDYLVGYRTRDLSVPAAHHARVWPGGGQIRPTVTADGLAVATWTRGPGGRPPRVEAFEPLPPRVRAGIEAESAAVTGFLSAKAPGDEENPR